MSKSPILSICVPTFNRAAFLVRLLNVLSSILDKYGAQVEVCISDNNSSDKTASVLANWRHRHNCTVITQAINIGATKNARAVVALSTGRWILIIGDDDLIDLSIFDELMLSLMVSTPGDWVLVGVLANRHSLLGNISFRRYSPNLIRLLLLKTGLYRFGFIGMHLIPSDAKSTFVKLSVSNSLPWPHLALFLRHIKHSYVRVFPPCVVIQSGSGSALRWDMGAWVRLNLRKIDIISRSRSLSRPFSWFVYALMFRELYSTRNIKELLLWRICEEETFFLHAISWCKKRYVLFGRFSFLTSIHFILVLIIRNVPISFHIKLFKLCGKCSSLANYKRLKDELPGYNGVDRVL